MFRVCIVNDVYVCRNKNVPTLIVNISPPLSAGCEGDVHNDNDTEAPVIESKRLTGS